jgi:uncharacterized protein involved in propanediol utilization
MDSPLHDEQISSKEHSLNSRSRLEYLAPLSRGHGTTIGQLGELFQGQVVDHRGSHRCLVSLPCPALVSQVIFEPSSSRLLSVTPQSKLKAQTVTALTLQYLGLPLLGGTIRVNSNIPEAKGCGSSTADCVAAVLATAESVRHTLKPEEIAQLVVAAEEASGSVMFANAVLFAHREGLVLEDYMQRLPPLYVLGFDTEEQKTVETLDMVPAQYGTTELEMFEYLVSSLRRAIRDGDIRLLGEVSTGSAVINEKFLPKRMFAEIHRLATVVDAVGVAVAHSGTMMAIMLDPDQSNLERQVKEIKSVIRRCGIKWLMANVLLCLT